MLSGAFFFQFTAWHATQNLQSTLPLHPSVSGTAALGIVYLTHCVSGPFSPAVVHALGARRCVVVGMLCYGSFIAAQLTGMLLAVVVGGWLCADPPTRNAA